MMFWSTLSLGSCTSLEALIVNGDGLFASPEDISTGSLLGNPLATFAEILSLLSYPTSLKMISFSALFYCAEERNISVSAERALGDPKEWPRLRDGLRVCDALQHISIWIDIENKVVQPSSVREELKEWADRGVLKVL